jgi:YebC/PmpR family DNA-binding regulatory protein
MAGHSKFKNIMHRKGRQDRVRAIMFSKLAREITVAARAGQPDPAMNPRLRLAIANARAQSMPKDNIQRAVDKGAGAGGENYESIRYEGFGPHGVGIIVEALTDNRNRAANDVRVAFSRNGGSLGATNTVVSQFERLGEVRLPLAVGDENAVLEAALEAGAADVGLIPADPDEEEPGAHVVICEASALNAVATRLAERFDLSEKSGGAVSATLTWRALAPKPLDEEAARQILDLLEALEDLDDVQSVHAGFEWAGA